MNGLFEPQRRPRGQLGPALATCSLERPLVRVLGRQRVTSSHLDLAEVDQHLGRGDAFARHELQHGLELRDRLVVGNRAPRLLGGQPAVVDARLDAADRRRCAEVVGELGEDRPRIRLVDPFEGLGDAQVQPRPRRRRQDLLDRVSDEGMGELIGRQTTSDLDEETGVDELVETGADLVDNHVGGQGQNAELDTLTGNCSQFERPPCPPRESGHARRDDIPDAVRRSDTGDVATNDPALVLAGHNTLLDEVAPQLAEEERVASAAIAGHRSKTTKVAVELLAEGAGDELFDAGGVETTQPQAHDALAALQVDQTFGERVGELGCGVAEGGDDHQPRRRAGTNQVPEQLERRTSCPMDVVEQEDHGRGLRGVGQGHDRRPSTAGTARSRDLPTGDLDNPGSIRSSWGSRTRRSPRSRSLLSGRPKPGRDRSR